MLELHLCKQENKAVVSNDHKIQERNLILLGRSLNTLAALNLITEKQLISVKLKK